MKSLLVGIKNVALWSYARGTWQYDALCLLIVLTVFLVPGSYFGDRDRVKQKSANETGVVASRAGETYVEAAELDGFLRRQNRIEPSQTPKERRNIRIGTFHFLRWKNDLQGTVQMTVHRLCP